MSNQDSERVDEAFKAWCKKHHFAFIPNAFADERAIEHPVITCFKEHHAVIESQRKELEMAKAIQEANTYIWNSMLSEQDAVVAQVEAENVLLKRELEELREAKGLLPVCEVDRELFAANVTCRQQAKLIEYHEKTIADQKREIEDCVEGMAMQSATIKDLRKELADASVMISQLTGQYDNWVKENL